jgi:8-oxo-dGTP pyrophosphatase MutT (NUDIX family)
MQLGGHCDGDQNMLNVAIKEAQEESGIKEIKPLSLNIFDIDIHLIPPSKKDDAHYHFDVRFLLHAYSGDKVYKNHESKELRWVERNSENVPTDSDSVTRMFKKLKSAGSLLDSLVV